ERSRSLLSSNALSPTAFSQRTKSSFRMPLFRGMTLPVNIQPLGSKTIDTFITTNIQICQEISRREVQIDQNQECAQNCRKRINDLQNSGGNEALIRESSSNHELKTYELKIAE
ncbi:hypothetical protein AVEN_199518-1, partial [Araneus ventricosus]